jgi:hypothetical protein
MLFARPQVTFGWTFRLGRRKKTEAVPRNLPHEAVREGIPNFRLPHPPGFPP